MVVPILILMFFGMWMLGVYLDRIFGDIYNFFPIDAAWPKAPLLRLEKLSWRMVVVGFFGTVSLLIPWLLYLIFSLKIDR